MKKYKHIECHDCKCQLKDGDEVMEFKTEFGSFFKCRKCNEQDKVLRNFRPTEVYSRIVGYIRPLGQWNPGKKSEFKDRFTYDINK